MGLKRQKGWGLVALNHNSPSSENNILGPSQDSRIQDVYSVKAQYVHVHTYIMCIVAHLKRTQSYLKK